MTSSAPRVTRRSRWLRPLHSVRVRITLAAVLVTTAAVAVTGWLLVRSVEDAQLRQLREDITSHLDRVAARLESGVDPQQAVERTPETPFVQVVDEEGRVVAAFPTFENDGETFGVRLDEEPGHTNAGSSVDSPLRPGEGPFPRDGTGPGRGGIVMLSSDEVVASPLETLTRSVDTPTGAMTVLAAAPVDQVARSLDALRGALLVGLPALVVLVAAIAWVLVGRALRPVEAVRAEVDEITGSTMHRRVPEPATGDEIGRLARTMNAMLGRLDDATTRQRQFVSDASHELRSPVTTIRTGLEVALDRADRANWPATARAALAEEARLEALLDDLLLLASGDESPGDGVPSASVDLTALAASEVLRPRRVPVRFADRPADEATIVAGSTDQLARVVSNLLDNAARYARTAVEIGLSRHDDTVRLTVDDDGPGIPPADRERVFERFTRLDDSRTRDQGGTGLGLAVVRSIVTRHHGHASAGTSPLGGARFTVELPTREPGRREADPGAERHDIR